MEIRPFMTQFSHFQVFLTMFARLDLDWDEVVWSNNVLSKFIFFLLSAVLSKSSHFWHSIECRSFKINVNFERTLFDQSISTYPKQVDWSKNVLLNSLLTEPNPTEPNLT